MKKISTKKKIMIVEAVIAIAAVVLAVVIGVFADRKTVSNEETENTVLYVSETESTDFPTITLDVEEDSTEESKKPKKTEEETEEALENYNFEDVVFVGDSRTLCMGNGGYLQYQLVPMTSISATWGGQLIDPSSMQDAQNAGSFGKKKAVFWYGINDVQMNPERDDAKMFIGNYATVIDEYVANNPNSEIYMLSILSTSTMEKDYYPKQEENILKYNREIKDFAQQRGYTYIDITNLFSGDEDFAVGDHIHFSKWWYEFKFLPLVGAKVGIVNEK